MNKKVIIDLNGVVFEPVERNFANVARAQYGRAKGAALTMAYKSGIGRILAKDAIAGVIKKCANNPAVRADTLDVLEDLAQMPDVTIEFCGQLAFPGQEYALEQKYRAIAPCMNAAARYELVSPFESKRGYLCRTTAADENTMNYIIGTCGADLDWPAKWRIIPVLIKGTAVEGASIYNRCSPRTFENLRAFQEFLARRR